MASETGVQAHECAPDHRTSRSYYGANQVFRLLLGRKVAAMVRHDPSILAAARSEIARMKRSPHKGDAISLWENILGMPAEAIADRLGEESPEADYLRETMPCFIGLDEAAMTDIVMRSRQIFKAQSAS